MNRIQHGTDHVLTGLDGANPLAFLAALGTLRLLSLNWRGRTVGLGWTLAAGAWRPILHIQPEATPDEVIEAVHANVPGVGDLFDADLLAECERAGPEKGQGKPKWRDKLRFPRDAFARRSRAGARDAAWDTRESIDRLAAWSTDAVAEEVEGVEVARWTVFDFTAGQQTFIGMVRELAELGTIDHTRAALFGPWSYAPGVVSMRWDPIDEGRQYALQAVDPTDSARNPILSVPGANLLALAAMPFFPLIPVGKTAEQPGLRGREFRWPIWRAPVGIPVVASILSLRLLTRSPLPRSELRAMGIEEVYRSRIVQPSGRYRNFTPAEAV